jgi:predicted transposase YdaD
MNREEQLAYRRYLDDRVILADQIYTARGEGKLEGRAEGREEGREEGRAEERMANALSLLQNGVSKEIVVKSLKLSEEEAANLRI